MSRGRREQAPFLGTARQLADCLALRIRGGDLPAGTRLDPAFLTRLHNSSPSLVVDALALLEGAGDIRQVDGRWQVSADRPRGAREIIFRAQPALVTVARLAALRATPQDAEAISTARDRLVGLRGDGSPQSRADGYRELMLRLGEASGSDFLLGAVRRLLREAAVMVDALARIDMLLNPTPQSEGELLRLTKAVAACDAEAAAEAMEDHVIIISHQMDAMSRS